jgi:drug/metabolite transporter (DMT)-like permease
MSASPIRRRQGLVDWALLLALTLMWGSAFALTKLAVAQLPPTAVVAGRLAIGAGLLLLWWWATRRRWPREPRLWFYFVLIALFGSVIPFSLITWGQQFIDSGLAGILMAVMPLFTLLLAHVTLPDERLTALRVAGFALGLLGVAVLLGPDIDLQGLAGDPHVTATLPAALAGTLAVLGGALCYAIAAILSRLRPPSDVVTTAAATATLAAMAGLALAHPDPSAMEIASIDAGPATAVLLLGLFSTGLASVAYFALIGRAGPAFVSQLNYLIPVWAVVLGALLFGERPAATDYVAMAIILGGVALSQRTPGTAAAATAADVRQRPGD